ncbi:MAG: sigma-70 family RNA polymerase sigma factor [Odoribacteraceae bacterium]|jgi:RNA polymerase sigma-70 factor (ECF subfamily)|nr:sigma-70 family RNA polymerase sigma factor [Odoribacteraceae bacterium]
MIRTDDPTGTSGREDLTLLFRRYYRPLVVFANTFVHRLEEAEDIVQEQFVKLWNGGNLGRVAEGALATYLFTVVKNACINFLEKRSLPLGTLDLPHYQIACREAETMDDEAAGVVARALEALPEKTRRVVERVVLMERSYKEAAGELRVSVNTIKTLLRLGLKELRVALKDHPALLLLFFHPFTHPFSHPFFDKYCLPARRIDRQ